MQNWGSIYALDPDTALLTGLPHDAAKDLLEPNRNWSQTPCMRDGMPMLRATVYAGQLAEAANLHTAMVIELFESQGFPVHPNHRRKLTGVGGRVTVEM